MSHLLLLLEQRRMTTLADSAPIAQVIDAILLGLGAQVQQSQRDQYVSKLEENLISTVTALKRLSSHRIPRLGLPLMIEEELDRIVLAFASVQKEPLIALQGLQVQRKPSRRPFRSRAQWRKLSLSNASMSSRNSYLRRRPS